MEVVKLSPSIIDDCTLELQDYFKNLASNFDIHPVLVENRLVLCKVKEEYDENGLTICKRIIGTPSPTSDNKYNGIEIKMVYVPEDGNVNG